MQASGPGHEHWHDATGAYVLGALDEAAEIRQVLTTLPPEQCRVIELAYFGGFTQTEIADMLDTPIGTVKGRMRLGLEKMRAQLGGLREVMP